MTIQDYNLISRLKGIAIKRCEIREDAEDIMQDVFLRILLRPDFENMTGNEKERFVVCLIRNRCTDYYRMKKHRGYAVDLSKVSLKLKPEVYGKMELKQVLKKAAGRLMCETLFLVVSGYKNIEVAAMTGQKINTVLARCRYARRFLLTKNRT